MIKSSRKIFKSAAIAAGAFSLVASGPVIAGYPEKPVKVIVGFSQVAALIPLREGLLVICMKLHQWMEPAGVVVNKPGSSGLIGAKIVKDGKADAYTLYMINIGTFTVADIAQTVTKGKSAGWPP